MQRWWKGQWRTKRCDTWEDRSPEYILFSGLKEADPDNRPGRCGDRQSAYLQACVDVPLPDIEPARLLNGAEPGSAEIVVKKLMSLRVILVRSPTEWSCYWSGFWCRPLDQDALLAELSNFTACGSEAHTSVRALGGP